MNNTSTKTPTPTNSVSPHIYISGPYVALLVAAASLIVLHNALAASAGHSEPITNLLPQVLESVTQQLSPITGTDNESFQVALGPDHSSSMNAKEGDKATNAEEASDSKESLNQPFMLYGNNGESNVYKLSIETQYNDNETLYLSSEYLNEQETPIIQNNDITAPILNPNQDGDANNMPQGDEVNFNPPLFDGFSNDSPSNNELVFDDPPPLNYEPQGDTINFNDPLFGGLSEDPSESLHENHAPQGDQTGFNDSFFEGFPDDEPQNSEATSDDFNASPEVNHEPQGDAGGFFDFSFDELNNQS